MALTDKQRGVLRGMAFGAILAALCVFGAPFVDALPRAAASPTERLVFALKCDLLPVMCLLLHIGALAGHRFRTPEDIDGSGLTSGTDKAKAMQAMLQNTLEQLVLAVSLHLIWAVMVPLAWTASIPAAAMCFVIGRIAFARGYMRGAPSRAFGFAATFYPSVMMSLVLLIGWVHGVLASW